MTDKCLSCKQGTLIPAFRDEDGKKYYYSICSHCSIEVVTEEDKELNENGLVIDRH
jgi:hypothetical protein